MGGQTGGQMALGVAETGCLRAAVIGAGSMGAGIAAQFANAGVAVDLLDMPADGRRNARAEAGIANQVRTRGFMGAAQAQLVRPGNVEDDFDRLRDADWIVEAVIEDPAVKRALFDRIEAVRKPGAVVSSNTSTIPRARLIEGRSKAFADHFLISHFFNPPRYMELLELVGPAEGAASAFALRAGRDVLGKTVVPCLDTPGFIANRIGCTWISVAIVEAVRLGLTVEEADAVHAAFGVPSTGAFGLMDLVGIDLIPHIWGSLMGALPADDTINRFDLPAEPVLRTLVETGRHGRKTGAGFYRRTAGGQREALELTDARYRSLRPVRTGDLPGGGALDALLADPGRLGDYARSVLTETLRYAARHAASIAVDPADVDTAMKLGYAWKRGPFEMIAALRDTGALPEDIALPAPSVRGATPLQDDRLARAKTSGRTIAQNAAASVRPLGDGLIALEIHTKMNAVNAEVMDMIDAALDGLAGSARGLVIGNHNPRAFSAGADLAAIVAMIDAGDWTGIEAFTARGQALYAALRRSSAPVVAAVRGVALGGGCEFLLHCDDAVLHAEAQVGLPESTLGLLPAWGGCVRTLERAAARSGEARGPGAVVSAAMGTILAPRPYGSAREAVAAGLLPETVGIAMSRDTVFDLAVARAGRLVDGYVPPPAPTFRCAGPSGASGMLAGLTARHAAGSLGDGDLAVAERIVTVLTGGPDGDVMRETDADDILALERQAFVALAATPLARERLRKLL
ncbi:3-hydroxyacyl-CoA dehydrogenase/enoyl-CoA hydratase family protein [Salipiger sp.]|uniref:3-hydroxyacyl-CoA dehydrogenase/enoyl-CoA hydratase family protein n=1 Tax=Salipiger sp. TaxID=2078585 RepID=UPI003A976A9D